MRHRASRARGRVVVAATAALVTVGVPLLRGQEPVPKPSPPQAVAPAKEAEGAPAWTKLTPDSIKPLPLESIPDSPPPHEGALFKISERIESPDLVLVEVLEGMPGRPITGERLVRPDGTVSLGFYGDLYVAGLTPAQAKVKLTLHLRRYLKDQYLGLISWEDDNDDQNGKPSVPVTDPRVLSSLEPMSDAIPLEPPAAPPPDAVGAAPPNAGDEPKHASFPKNTSKAGPLRAPHAAIPPVPAPFDPVLPQPPKPVAERGPNPMPGPAPPPGRYVYVDPAETSRVFVMISSYNHDMYYVQGDVAKIGRLTYTGNETVFDALQFAGGLLPSADRLNIRLHRPARGDKPSRSYRIDLDAIERGDKTANLQLFPGDRLIIERKKNLEPRS